MRARLPLAVLLGLASLLSILPLAHAAIGGADAASPMAGNGHNVTFDGRIFVVRRGNDDAEGGWMAMILRPERVRYAPGGVPILTDGAFTDPALIQPFEAGENALALCEENADDTPYACDDAGARNAAGPYACYDLWVIDSNAMAGQVNNLRRRRLKLWVANPSTGDATLHRHQWSGTRELLRFGGADLRGIEPTVTRDGRLLVWQGHPSNDGEIDVLMYSTNASPCAATGWSQPQSISHMYMDASVRGRYRLAERQLRAADGTPFADRALFHGAYPWIFPNGDAINFTGAPMPCRGTEDPGGCGPRRNALSVIGYPTNFGIAHIDGDVNPSTEDTVRLFFSSPGPIAFPQLPISGGRDVWPFFGSNTSNYTEVVFDDALDGQYAAVLHMNESINVGGALDRARTPDTSGYFNTGRVMGATFPAVNNGLFGKALVFGGDGDLVELTHSGSLDPTNALSVELWLRPSAAVECDGNNNYRVLLQKGDLSAGSYSLVFEEGEHFQARVRAGGVTRSVTSTRGIPVGEWSHVGFTYEAATGALRFFINGEAAGSATGAPGTLSGSTQPLRIGGPGGARARCPNGDGAFEGEIDEVRISSIVRDLTVAARPGQNARFVSQVVPPQVEAGLPFTAHISFRNIGTTAWSAGTGHRLGAQMPTDNTVWGVGRVELPRRVLPGDVVTISATLTAPSALGAHPMQWQIVHDGTEWIGALSEALSVEVVPPGTLPDAGPPPDAGPLPGDDAGMMMMPPEEDAGTPPLMRVDAGTTPGRDGGGGSGIDAGVGGTPDAGGRMTEGGCAVGREAGRREGGSPRSGLGLACVALACAGLTWRRRRRG